jgi:hypothetical protein
MADPRLHLEKILLDNIHEQLPQLQDLLDRDNSPFGHGYENSLYKYYSQSLKVFGYQTKTLEIVNMLRAIAPDGRGFCSMFTEFVWLGTGHEFQLEDNHHWIERTAPLVQAYFHARNFLEMALRYAAASPPLHVGWAALLSLYDIY